jgi:hypothetical protein
MRRLTNDHTLQNRLALAGREYVARHFDQQYIWYLLLRKYREKLQPDTES